MRRPDKAEGSVQRRGAMTALALPLAAMLLAGCSSVPRAMNPVEWYRDLTGASKNDNQGDERNAGNLAAGGKEPFPNLSSVPPPPERALSAAEREALQKSLIADRDNARYSEEQLQAGRTAAGAPAAPPAPAAARPAAPLSDAAPRRAPARPEPQTPPQESALAAPTARSEPEGDAPRAAPPPPNVPPAAEGARRPAPAAAASARAVAAPQMTAMAAPPPPAIVPNQPPPLRTAAPGGAKPGGPVPANSVEVAEIAFADGSSAVSASERRKLDEAVRRHRENGGMIRIVGYAARGRGKDASQQELQSFGLGLERAKAVAAALGELGVPAKEVAIEAAPLTAGDGGAQKQRAEVFVEY
jgi:outer membrane protein OmpA-like peptidoglycan-associated protein